MDSLMYYRQVELLLLEQDLFISYGCDTILLGCNGDIKPVLYVYSLVGIVIVVRLDNSYIDRHDVTIVDKKDTNVFSVKGTFVDVREFVNKQIGVVKVWMSDKYFSGIDEFLDSRKYTKDAIIKQAIKGNVVMKEPNNLGGIVSWPSQVAL